MLRLALFLLALSFAGTVLGADPATVVVTPEVPWWQNPAFLASAIGVLLLVLRYFGVIKTPNDPPAPPTDPTVPPAVPMTIQQFIDKLFADKQITFGDILVLIEFIRSNGWFAGGLMSDAQKMAIIELLAKRKAA